MQGVFLTPWCAPSLPPSISLSLRFEDALVDNDSISHRLQETQLEAAQALFTPTPTALERTVNPNPDPLPRRIKSSPSPTRSTALSKHNETRPRISALLARALHTPRSTGVMMPIAAVLCVCGFLRYVCLKEDGERHMREILGAGALQARCMPTSPHSPLPATPTPSISLTTSR